MSAGGVIPSPTAVLNRPTKDDTRQFTIAPLAAGRKASLETRKTLIKLARYTRSAVRHMHVRMAVGVVSDLMLSKCSPGQTVVIDTREIYLLTWDFYVSQPFVVYSFCRSHKLFIHNYYESFVRPINCLDIK